MSASPTACLAAGQSRAGNSDACLDGWAARARAHVCTHAHAHARADTNEWSLGPDMLYLAAAYADAAWSRWPLRDVPTLFRGSPATTRAPRWCRGAYPSEACGRPFFYQLTLDFRACRRRTPSDRRRSEIT